MRRLGMLAAALAAFCWQDVACGETDIGPRPPGAFDYYVLSLTWAPSFCASHDDPGECSKGLGFAMHGLWPELEGGAYPTGCSAVGLSASDRTQFAAVYADPSLIDHEWPKHGTCSGLSASDYFALALADENKVVIPPALRSPHTIRTRDAASVRQAFVSANPGMPTGALRVVIVKGLVSEVDVCLTKDGVFRSC